ncbi:MAG: hypothetical protein GX085_03355 [Firmicutes bacterium]|jgi:hypothetical protein|nr:hypothetical protein [Bacillota bacterium]
MRIRLRYLISRFPSHAEIYISLIIMIAVVIGSIGLIRGLYDVYLNARNMEFFQDFLGYAMTLVIAIEFIKMLLRHTPGSIIEVLLFAMARKLIITKENTLGLLLGIIAIAVLFITRKFLFVSRIAPSEGIILSAATPVKEVRKIMGLDIPDVAETLGGLVVYAARKSKKSLSEDEIYELDGLKMKINRLLDGIIEMVEVIEEKD